MRRGHHPPAKTKNLRHSLGGEILANGHHPAIDQLSHCVDHVDQLIFASYHYPRPFSSNRLVLTQRQNADNRRPGNCLDATLLIIQHHRHNNLVQP